MKNSQKGFIVQLLLVIIAVLVVGGGVYIYENKKTEAPVVVDNEAEQTKQTPQQTDTQTPNQLPNNQSDSVKNQVIEKTALLSFTEFFCYWTEQSKPFAYFQFAYQENGEIKYIRTKTTCDDLIKIGAPNDASKSSTLFGEKIKLEYNKGKLVKIIRENGNNYQIESSEQIRSFFSSKINVYDNLKYLRNSNSDEVTSECLLIKDDAQHDRCLSYQAAFQKNTDICGKMNMTSNQDLCRQWISNLEQGSVNN